MARWLLDRALEHDRPLLLWQLASEKLAAEKVVRPGVTVLERIVVAARRGAERETMKRLAAVLDEPGRSLLDGLLIPDEATDRTLLTWLRQGRGFLSRHMANPGADFRSSSSSIFGENRTDTDNFHDSSDLMPRPSDTTGEGDPARDPGPQSGYIGLQNHDQSSVVFFKEVSVRPLSSARQ